MVKQLSISVIIGLIAYEVSGLATLGDVRVPDSTAEIILLILFVITAVAASLLSGSSSGSIALSDSDREKGTVKWFNVRKGYGFITRDQGEDIFVHFRNIDGKDRRAISEGQRVTFIVTEGDKGLQADKVTPA